MQVLPVEQPRIFGIETEHGIHPMPPYCKLVTDVVSADTNPETHRSINEALPGYLHPSSRGFSEFGRIYADQERHIEVCTPELLTIRGLLASYFAGEELADQIATTLFGNDIHAQKRSVDFEGNSRGEHDNFLVGKGFAEAHQYALCSYFASRIVLTGPGMVHMTHDGRISYAIDQRARIMSGPLIAPGSVNGKPFMKSFNQAKHFDTSKATKRLQVVCSSQNRFPFPVAARMFNTSAILRLIERGKYPDDLHFDNPMEAIRAISTDPTLTLEVSLRNGKQYTALQVQQELLEAALRLHGLPDEERTMATLSANITADLMAGDSDKWQGHLEWLAKQKLLRAHATSRDYVFPGFKSASLDIKWHTTGPDSIPRKLWRLGKVAMVPTSDDVEAAKRMAPDATRALARAYALKDAFNRGAEVATSNWHSWQLKDEEPTIIDDAYGRTLVTGGAVSAPGQCPKRPRHRSA